MKKKILFLIVLFNFSFLGIAQNAQKIIDGLYVDLKANPDEKKIATIYSDLTWYYSNISLDSAMTYGKKAIIASTKLKDSTLIAQVYSDVGAVYFKKGDYKASEKSYLEAYKIRKIRKDFVGLAKINANLANVYQTQERYAPAMKANLESLIYFKNINNLKNVNLIKGNIANLLFKMRDYKKAVIYINEAIVYQLENKLSNDLCKTYITKGNILLNMKDTIKSQKSYNLALKYCNEVDDKYASSSIYSNLSTIKAAQNKTKEAEKLYQNAKTERKILNSDLNSAKLKFILIDKLIYDKKFDHAKTMLHELKQIFLQKKSMINVLNVYKKLIPVCSNLNQKDSVLFYSDSYINLFEEILQQNSIQQTSELETKYQTVKKEKQIIAQQAEAAKKNSYLIGLFFIILFLILLGYLIYRQQKLKNKQQSQAFELKQAISQIETQNKLQSQRLAISKDLHDNIGAQLTFIISSVETAKFAPEIENTTLGNKLTQISTFTKDTINELRDTVWAMNSDDISFQELQSRILNFIDKATIAVENIDFKFNIENELDQVKLTSIVGMNIYRTLQEAINNSLKYAQASCIIIDIRKTNKQILIEIADNGIGFDPQTIILGNGLHNMRKRIDEIGGKFDLKSQNLKGTTVTILIDN